MWKFVNGQWEAIPDNEISIYSNMALSYKDWIVMGSNVMQGRLGTRYNQSGQAEAWIVELNVKSYATKVYIDNFPDLFAFLRDFSAIH